MENNRIEGMCVACDRAERRCQCSPLNLRKKACLLYERAREIERKNREREAAVKNIARCIV